jgi:D-alanyl-lipoteichoic acid acyltransferase DltB (MBOAT superfamily)
MSLWFYGYFNVSYLLIIIGSIVINYLSSRLIIYYKKKNNALSKLFTILAILINVAIIFYYKYYDFFITNINALIKTNFNLKHLILPLGISFFTFQQISFIVDSYASDNDDIKNYNFIEYALFVSFFPQLVAGPIVLHSELIPQFRDDTKRKFSSENFNLGLYVFAVGLFKKMVIADTVGSSVDFAFSNVSSLTSLESAFAILLYTLQIYFDFSGYSDMARGLAKMLNIDIIPNFNSPYKSVNILDFWDRWHMSLTRFMKTYIYIPLGGSRCGSVLTYLNVLIVFAISGLWHGANWTFVLWGIMHGVLNVITRIIVRKKKEFKFTPLALPSFIFTFAFVCVTFCIFRADNVSQGFMMIKNLFNSKFYFAPENLEFIKALNRSETDYILRKVPFVFNLITNRPEIYLYAFSIATLVITFFGKNTNNAKPKATCIRSVITAGMLIYCIMKMSGLSTFLYFNF